MELDKLTILDANALAARFGGGAGNQARQDRGWCIVILDRGHVLVGNVVVDGDWVTTTDASVIRVWGTTRGLGEIAKGGPTSTTKLDPIGTVRSPLRAVIGIVDCEAAKWNR